MDLEQKPTTLKEAGSIGGRKNFEKNGKVGNPLKGGITTRERYGSEHYRKIQKKGVQTKRKNKELTGKPLVVNIE